MVGRHDFLIFAAVGFYQQDSVVEVCHRKILWQDSVVEYPMERFCEDLVALCTGKCNPLKPMDAVKQNTVFASLQSCF